MELRDFGIHSGAGMAPSRPLFILDLRPTERQKWGLVPGMELAASAEKKIRELRN